MRKKLNMYEIIFKDVNTAFIVNQVATSEKEAKERCWGNGEIVRIEKVNWPLYIDAIENALREHGFGQTEIRAVKDIIRIGYSDVIEGEK